MAEITKEVFIDAMNALRSQYYIDYENSQILESIFPCSDISGYDNSILIGTIIRLLRIHFPVVDGVCPLENFCYDGNFNEGEKDETLFADALWNELTKQKV
jgi:hypothetical protein